jgi:hypothetical protein
VPPVGATPPELGIEVPVDEGNRRVVVEELDLIPSERYPRLYLEPRRHPFCGVVPSKEDQRRMGPGLCQVIRHPLQKVVEITLSGSHSGLVQRVKESKEITPFKPFENSWHRLRAERVCSRSYEGVASDGFLG